MKPFQAERLKLLRLAATSAVQESGKVPEGPVHLIVRIYAHPEMGDLDSFVSGICDGLMAAHPLVLVDPSLWSDLPEEARPDRPIMFVDDRVITKIEAERCEPTRRELGTNSYSKSCDRSGTPQASFRPIVQQISNVDQ